MLITVRSSQVLGQLCHWLESRDTPATLDHIDEMMIRRFILFLQQKPGVKAKTMSTHTIYNKVNALRSFFGWLHRQGYTDEHVLQHLKQPKTANLVIDPLSREEIDRIMGAINPKTALGARNTALAMIMVDTGLRVSEIAGLKDRDVHIEWEDVQLGRNVKGHWGVPQIFRHSVGDMAGLGSHRIRQRVSLRQPAGN